MAWVEAVFRGQKVFARADAAGKLVSEGGRVEIRYKRNDGRAYRAATRNLLIPEGALPFPEDHCGPAEVAAAPTGKATSLGPGRIGPGRSSVHAVDQQGRWIAYTDGACTGNPGPAGAGFVIILPDGKIWEGFESLGMGTNNIAELMAVLRALEAVTRGKALVVHTDSKYAIGVLTAGWKAKANQDLIARIRGLLERRPEVSFVYVPGHAGVPMNERADELAREAVRTGSSRPLPSIPAEGVVNTAP